MIRKGVFFAIFLFSLTLASAINLDIQKEVINEVVISELEIPAVFDFTIKNNGDRDSFEIYSLVSVELSPRYAFSLSRGETERMKVEALPSPTIRKNPGYFSFVYKIKGANTGTQEDKLTIKIVPISEALQVTSESINPNSKTAVINIENLENFEFKKVNAVFSSVFFLSEQNFSLQPFEKKSFIISLEQEKTENLMAGTYLLDVKLSFDEFQKNFDSSIKFLEKSGLSITESKEGFLIIREEVEKRNEGNIPVVAEISLEKNEFSRLFTTTNIPPSKIERNGLTKTYYWNKELRPGESFKVVMKTNWIIPLFLALGIILFVVLFNIYLKSDLKVTKKITQVKTKGGEFALKVSINARAKRYVEKINIIDKLPPIVKLYKRYGTIVPDRIDEKNRRIEWNIENLNQGEDRIVSYIIYSKIGVIGRFELPPAKAIYERASRIKETQSNKVFFVSEPGKKLKEYN